MSPLPPRPNLTLVLVSGASRGFGKAIVRKISESHKLFQPRTTDIVVTSTNAAHLEAEKIWLEKVGFNVVALSVDYRVVASMKAHVDEISQSLTQPLQGYASIYVFHNAGSLGTLEPVHSLSPASYIDTITILWTFINTSSLAAVQPFEYWAQYCSVKAARDMFFQCLAKESSIAKSAIRVLNYAPGPLDTDMQTHIRTEMVDSELKQTFTKMKADQMLVDPHVSAGVLLKVLEMDVFENGAHVDFYDIK